MDDPGARHPPDDLDAGAPRWLTESLNFCPRCGASLARGRLAGEDRERHHCAACGFIVYLNPRLVVSTLPVTDAGEIVLLRRAIEPGRGAWAQPGGFLEADETAVQGAVRETIEETGLEVEPVRVVGLYSRIQAANDLGVEGAAGGAEQQHRRQDKRHERRHREQQRGLQGEAALQLAKHGGS